jgi:ribosomal-protein-alanine N-acetyltransferase
VQIDIGEYQIRSYRKSDKDSIIKYANNINVSRNLRDSFPFPYTKKDAADWLRNVCYQKIEMNFALANGEELIGGIGLMPQSDVYKYSAEIGYWLAEPFWGKGITTNAVIEMTKFAFDNFNFNRLFAAVFEGNPASARVLEKAGYKLEGTLRKSVFKEGIFKDQMMY